MFHTETLKVILEVIGGIQVAGLVGLGWIAFRYIRDCGNTGGN